MDELRFMSRNFSWEMFQLISIEVVCLVGTLERKRSYQRKKYYTFSTVKGTSLLALSA